MRSISDWMTHYQGPVWWTPNTLPPYAPLECDSKIQYTLSYFSVSFLRFYCQNIYPFLSKCYLLSIFFFKSQLFCIPTHNFCSCSLHPVRSTQFIYVGARVVMVAEKVWKRKFLWPWISNMGNLWLKNNCLLMSSKQWHRMPLFLYIPETISCLHKNLIWISTVRNDSYRWLAE